VRFWKRGKLDGEAPPLMDPVRLESADGPPKGPENFVVSTGVKLSQAYWDLVNGKFRITP
jgi:hypothetical protein